MTTTIRVPDFSYFARSYAQIRQDIRQRNRIGCPEITVEDDRDPFMQAEMMAAYMGHYCGSLADWIARHMLLPTSLYRPGVDAQLRTVDEHLAGPAPSAVDVLARLTRTFTAAKDDLVPALSRFATVPGAEAPAVTFESPATPIGTERTDELLSYRYSVATGAFSAVPVGAADLWAAPAAGDMLYIGHADLMLDEVYLPLGTAAVGLSGVWEYLGTTEAHPTGVVYAIGPPATLTFDLTSLLGASDRSGALVTILCPATGQSLSFTSTWGGGINRVVTAVMLGQAVPSAVAADYIVSAAWTELPGVAGGNDGLDSIVDTDVTWTLPQTVAHDWTSGIVNGLTGYWVRFRVVTAAATQPRVAAIIGPGDAEMWVKIPCTQGQTVSDTLGISDGTASQSFPLNRTGYIEGTLTALTVGSDADWVVSEEKTDLYAAEPAEKIALLEVLPDGSYQVLFGDGTHGAIPPTTEGIVASYRIGADDDGNVGAAAITRQVRAIAYLTDVTNPRAAVGWAAAEGSTEEDLERVKRTKPAAFRSGGRAVNADDCESLVESSFVTSTGVRPVARSWGAEEAYGLKTIGLTVVGNGGGLLSAALLLEVNEYFNGSDPNDPERRLVANHELTASSYDPLVVGGAVTIKVRKSLAGVEAQAQTLLAILLRPLDQLETGEWRWQPGRFGGKVRRNQIEGYLYQKLTVRQAIEVEVTLLNGLAADITLDDDELPFPGVWIVTPAVL